MGTLEGTKQWLLFGLGATIYDAVTGHDVWMAQVASALSHTPWIDIAASNRVVDLGCGPGVSAFALGAAMPQATVLGVDLSRAMIARAERHRHRKSDDVRSRVKFVCADAASLSQVEAGSVDLVFGHSFLYLVPDPDSVLAEVRRMLRPQGTLLLMEPRREGTLWRAVQRVQRPRGARLGDQVRFATSMVLWRAVSSAVGQMDGPRLGALLERAGFASTTLTPTLAGLGWHAIGRVESD